jgi:hypothetical protein
VRSPFLHRSAVYFGVAELSEEEKREYVNELVNESTRSIVVWSIVGGTIAGLLCAGLTALFDLRH